jgi:two-component system response regulator YesN
LKILNLFFTLQTSPFKLQEGVMIMWRAILVDDEKFVRMELKAVFPWQRYQFDLIGEAEDARGAMELIERTQPDLVITDIRMPEIDGLELISWIGKTHPQISVAVVSAFNDFPLVREALRLGAVDYLMKAEANSKTAGVFLERIGGILDHRDSARRRQDELTSNIEHYQRLAIEVFWRDVLTRASDEAEIDIRARQLGIISEYNWFGLIFIHVSNYQAHWSDQQPKFRSALEAEIQANWDWNWTWHLIDIKRGDFVIIASSTGAATFAGVLAPKPEELEKIQKIASRLTLDSTEKRTVSASSHLCSFPDLAKNFREVREVNLLRLYHQEGRYLEAHDLLRLRQTQPPKTSELLTEWERILQGNKPEALRDFLESVFQNTLPQCLAPEEARWLALDLIITLRRVALEHQVRWEELGDGEGEPSEILEKAETVSDWQTRIETLGNRYFQSAKINHITQAPLPIRKALKFIQSNFTRELSLEEVARHAGVSKSYLSRVFSEYAGEHFCNYLQRLRVEHAKELLRFTNEHIYEIATKVGFWNSRYFSRVFHEITGLTPADFRRAENELDNE